MLARLTLLLAVALTGCIRDDPNHCANQSGDRDAYCVEKYEMEGYCSSCTPKFDGCVGLADIQKDPACHVGAGGTTHADDDSADPTSMSLSMSDSVADDNSATSNVSTSTEGSTVDDSSGSSTTGPQGPVCGDGVQEDPEYCDTPDPTPCRAFGQGEGVVICNQTTCVNDFSGCSEQVPICGDGIINRPDEECDVTDFDKATCGDQPGHGNAGELACTAECEIDASGCCLDAGEPCELNAQCCTGLCGLLEQGPDCILG